MFLFAIVTIVFLSGKSKIYFTFNLCKSIKRSVKVISCIKDPLTIRIDTYKKN